jgi:hypothetical protein
MDCAQPTTKAAPVQPPPRRPPPLRPPILRSQKYNPALWAHNLSLMPRAPPLHIIGLEYETPTLHRLRSASDETTLLRDFCFAHLTAMAESSIPHGSRFLGPSTIYLCVHDCLRDDRYSNKSWSIVGQGMFQL